MIQVPARELHTRPRYINTRILPGLLWTKGLERKTFWALPHDHLSYLVTSVDQTLADAGCTLLNCTCIHVHYSKLLWNCYAKNFQRYMFRNISIKQSHLQCSKKGNYLWDIHFSILSVEPTTRTLTLGTLCFKFLCVIDFLQSFSNDIRVSAKDLSGFQWKTAQRG